MDTFTVIPFCSITWVCWDFEQHGLVEHVPAHGRRMEQDDVKGVFQSKPCCESINSNSQSQLLEWEYNSSGQTQVDVK